MSIAGVMALLVAIPLAPCWAISTGKLYDDGKLIGEITEIGQELGYGGYSRVYEVTFQDPQGQVSKRAAKEFLPSVRADVIEETKQNWAHLEPVYSEDHEKVLSRGHAGLKLIPDGPLGTQSISQVILLDLSDGSAQSIASSMKLSPNHPYFGAKIEVALKYCRDILSAIKLLSSHGLAHGDVKPENVLYSTKPGYDLEKPDISKIHFSLADFDTLAYVGQVQKVFTEGYAAPELVVDEIERASAQRDLYSHAVAVHTLIFGDHPFERKFKSLHGSSATSAEFEAELSRVFDNPKLYEEYLKSTDDRFRDLENSAKTETSRQHLQELRDFVLKGLKLNPHERLAAFPEIKTRLQRYAEAQRNCRRVLISGIESLNRP
jgi:serine/threonine protein kinase